MDVGDKVMEVVSYLVWAAPALLDQDLRHLRMVSLGSPVYWNRTTIFRQQWVSPCLKKCHHKGKVTLLAGHVQRCGFYFVP